MTDAVPGKFAPHASTVCLSLAHSLAGTDANVRLASLNAYETCANAVSVCPQGDEPWKVVGELVPAVAKVAYNAESTALGPNNGTVGSTKCTTDEDELSRVLCLGFGVFAMLGDSVGSIAMKPYFTEVFYFALEMAVPPGCPILRGRAHLSTFALPSHPTLNL